MSDPIQNALDVVFPMAPDQSGRAHDLILAALKAEGWRIVKLEKVRWERVSEHGTVYSYTVEDEL